MLLLNTQFKLWFRNSVFKEKKKKKQQQKQSAYTRQGDTVKI